MRHKTNKEDKWGKRILIGLNIFWADEWSFEEEDKGVIDRAEIPPTKEEEEESKGDYDL